MSIFNLTDLFPIDFKWVWVWHKKLLWSLLNPAWAGPRPVYYHYKVPWITPIFCTKLAKRESCFDKLSQVNMTLETRKFSSSHISVFYKQNAILAISLTLIRIPLFLLFIGENIMVIPVLFFKIFICSIFYYHWSNKDRAALLFTLVQQIFFANSKKRHTPPKSSTDLFHPLLGFIHSGCLCFIACTIP